MIIYRCIHTCADINRCNSIILNSLERILIYSLVVSSKIFLSYIFSHSEKLLDLYNMFDTKILNLLYIKKRLCYFTVIQPNLRNSNI